jgi:TolB-like protein
MTGDPQPRPIDLAHEPSFEMSGIEVRPATLEVLSKGRRTLLEPRIMQVLVALARRRGEVVSRDELIELCWGGRIVGEDAIGRCISKLRKLGQAQGGFTIDAVPRVGVRLDPIESAAPASAAEVRLAVLPFDNLSGDAAITYLSDGLSEEILQTVAKRGGIKVIGRSSSFQLRGPDKAAHRVAEALKATHLLDGSVRLSGGHVRVLAHLIECGGQTTLWSDRYDRGLADALALQDEIAEAVATALAYKLGRPRAAGEVDPVAYDLYLRARASGSGDVVGSAPADWLEPYDVRLLEQATDRAPGFARAWAALALGRAIEAQSTTSIASFEADRDGAIRAAETALGIDPNCGEAYGALDLLEPLCGRYVEREALVDRAVSVAPDDPIVLHQASVLKSGLGRLHEAYALSAHAREMDPLSSHATFWSAYLMYQVGLRDAALAAWDRGRRRWPRHEGMTGVALYYAACAGDWARVDRLADCLRSEGPWPPRVFENLVAAEALRDPGPDVRARVVRMGRAQLQHLGTVRFEYLGFACLIGLTEEAYGLAAEASFEHLFAAGPQSTRTDMSLHPLFDIQNTALRDDVRFIELCGRVGLCDYWLKTDRWPDCAAEVPYDFRAKCARGAARET